jgi:hypothetical protein
MIIFCLVWFLLKKIIKLVFFLKTQNWFKPIGFGLVILEKNRLKPVWYGFSGLARFFSGFGSGFSGLA